MATKKECRWNRESLKNRLSDLQQELKLLDYIVGDDEKELEIDEILDYIIVSKKVFGAIVAIQNRVNELNLQIVEKLANDYRL